jgi:competence ComEA-like helix-hairpin-helix protein
MNVNAKILRAFCAYCVTVRTWRNPDTAPVTVQAACIGSSTLGSSTAAWQAVSAMLYSAPQLRLLLVLATIFLAGLGIRQWRAGFSDTASWLECFDREEPPAPLLPTNRESSPVATPRVASVEGAPPRREPRAISASPVDANPRPLDINRATVAELARLPGVGPGLAQRIFDERERRGRFDSPEALRRVVGIGPKKLAALRDLVTVGE